MPDTASDPGAQVARRIVKAATLEEAVAATRDGLTRGGLTISDFNRTTQPALEPLPTSSSSRPRPFLLAYEARQHAANGRMTLDEFAGMLADFGWPFEGEGMPGDQLMAAAAAPTQPAAGRTMTSQPEPSTVWIVPDL